MKKIYIILIAAVVFISVAGYFYISFIRTTGYKTKIEVTESFVNELAEGDVCENHYIDATLPSCTIFVDLLVDDTVVLKSITAVQEDNIVVLTIEGTDVEFRFHYEVTKNSGIKRIFNKEYYLIQYVE